MASFYIDIVQVGCGILISIGLGYFLAKFKFYMTPEFKDLNKFTSKISLPFLMFNTLSKTKFKDINFNPVLVALLMNISSHIVLLIIFVLPIKMKLRTYITTAISSCYVNYIIIGLPIFTAIWGPQSEAIIVMCPLVHYVFVVPLFIVLTQLMHIIEANEENDKSPISTSPQKSETVNENQDSQNPTEEKNPDSSQKHKQKLTIKDVGKAFLDSLKTPIIIGAFLGLLWAATGITPPLYLLKFTDYFGRLVTTYSLLSIGSFIYRNSIFACPISQLIASLSIRFIFAPLISIAWSSALHLNGTLARQCSILGTFPLSTVAYALAVSQEIGMGATSSVVFFTSIFIVPIIMWWFYFLDLCHLFPEK